MKIKVRVLKVDAGQKQLSLSMCLGSGKRDLIESRYQQRKVQDAANLANGYSWLRFQTLVWTKQGWSHRRLHRRCSPRRSTVDVIRASPPLPENRLLRLQRVAP